MKSNKNNGKIPGLVRVILCLAERSVMSELAIRFAFEMVFGFLPNGYIILFHELVPAQTFSYILNFGLLFIQILFCSFPSFPMFLPTNWWPR